MSCFTRQQSATPFADPDPTKHVNYAQGMVLGVDDFTQEFAYLSGRDQWAARDLIGYGTARGLRVTVEVDAQGPRVVVSPGVAVSPRGQLICVEAAQCAYLNQWLAAHARELPTRLGSPPEKSVRLYVVLCYRDCPTDNVPIPGEPCRNDSQLTAPSRLADDFELELSFRKPEQREEEAVNAFAKWLKQVPVTGAASTPLEQFLQAIRDAAGAWPPPTSPPASPPVVIMPGSPPSFLNINPADLCRYTEAAFRLWVTELRPRWIGRRHGCAPAPFGLTSEHDEECVLLAELNVPLLQNLPSAQWVAGSGVQVFEESRPYLVHLRMLQEWLLCAQQRGQQAAAAVTLAGDVTGPPDSNVLRRFNGVEVESGATAVGQVLSVADAGGGRKVWRATTPTNTTAVAMGGDVTGQSNNSTVQRIRNTPVDATAPTNGQVLTAFGVAPNVQWRPATPTTPPPPTLAGDVTGATNNTVVERIRSTPVDATRPSDGQVLMAVGSGASAQWRASNLPAPIAPAVALGGDVTGAAGNTTVERIRNVTVDATKPSAGQMLTAVQVGAETQWRPTGNYVRFTADRNVPSYGIVAAGIVSGGIGTRAPSYGNLRVPPAPGPSPGILTLTFDGYQLPTQKADKSFTHHYIVKVTPLTLSDQFLDVTVTFREFQADNFTLRVTNAGLLVPADTLRRMEFMVEVSRFPMA